MKQVFSKYLGKQQYLYLALAIIGICFAGASLVLAEETEPALEARLEADVTVNAALQSMPEEKKALFEARQNALMEKRASFAALKEERTEMNAEKRLEIQARIAEKRALLDEAAQARVRMLAGTTADRLEQMALSLESLVVRIETHIEKREAEGFDTTDAALSLEEAKQNLAEAQVLIDGLSVEIDYTVTSGDPKSDWTKAKEEFQAAHRLIQEARALLHQTVAALKGVSVEASMNVAQ